MDSNNGGETRRPEIAERTDPKALRGLSSSPSSRASRSAASITSVFHRASSMSVSAAIEASRVSKT